MLGNLPQINDRYTDSLIKTVREIQSGSCEASFLNDWYFDALISDIGDGRVYRVVNKDGSTAAIRIALMFRDKNEAQSEKEVLKRLQESKCALTVKGYTSLLSDDFTQGYNIFLTEDYVPVGELNLSRSDIILAAKSICSALGACHSRVPELIHCAVTPETLVRTKSGAFKLTGFFDCRTRNDGAPPVNDYSAPEVSRGLFDCRSDIYSVGAVMKNMLERSTLSFEQSVSLLEVISKACADNPNSRYQSVNELRMAVDFMASANYGTETVHLISDVASGRLDTPAKVKEYFQNGRFSFESFGYELWRLLLIGHPCERMKRLLGAASGGINEIKDALSKEIPGFDVSAVDEFFQIHPKPSLYKMREFMRDCLIKRCSQKVLCRPCTCKKVLVDFMVSVTEGAREDSVSRTVNNWFTYTNEKLDRSKCIQLCYALGLRCFKQGERAMMSEGMRDLDAECFLGMVCRQDPFHVRKPDEAIFFYCLMRPMDEKLPPNEKYDPVKNYAFANELLRKYYSYAAYRNAPGDGNSSVPMEYTQVVRNSISESTDTADLLDLLLNLSSMPNVERYAASKYITQFYRDLQVNAVELAANTAALTKELATRTVMALKDIDEQQISSQGIKEAISKYTLSELLYKSGIIVSMAEGRIPIERNIMLLCSLAMGYGIAYVPGRRTPIRETADFIDSTSFTAFFEKIAATLRMCCFSPLYPRSKFDFMILYSYYLGRTDLRRGRAVDSIATYLTRAVTELSAADNIIMDAPIDFQG